MCPIIDWLGCGRRRIVEHADGNGAAQNTMDHSVDAGERNRTCTHRRQQGLAEKGLGIQLLSGLLVETGHRRFGSGVDGTPVRHDPSLIMPIVTQNAREQEVIFARPERVDLVVGAHHRCWSATLDGDLKGQQVALAKRRLRDLCVEHVSSALLGIERQVLDRGRDVVRLDAANALTGQDATQQRIFAEVTRSYARSKHRE